MAISIDWMPTIAQYCGLKPPDHKIDGRSIVPVIESPDAPSPHKVLHWETSRGKHWAVREGNWKLVHNGPATDYKGRKLPKVENFLSNIAEDATETKNLAKSNPDIVKRLTNLHEQWLKENR
jgi:arylsulfatase A-like enzyme